MIHTRYEDYTLEGFNVLYTKQPVIYISSAARPGLGQALCNQVKSIRGVLAATRTYLASYCLHSFGDFDNLFFLMVEITAKEAESILGITLAVVDHTFKIKPFVWEKYFEFLSTDCVLQQ